MKNNGLRAKLAARVREFDSIDEVRIAHQFFGPGGTGRLMIDVGAHMGGSLAPFAEEGWTVHAFEPNPRNRAEIQARWDGAPNVQIDPRAVADVDVHQVSFLLSSNSYIGSLSAFDASHSEALAVEQVSLGTYCRENKITSVDLLKIDAEGHDYEVLKGFPWTIVRPRFVICEFEDKKTRSRGYGFKEMADLLLAQGYHIMVSEWYPIVSYDGPFRWKQFHPYPGPVPPGDSNGNLMAVGSPGDFRRLQRLCRNTKRLSSLASGFRSLYARLRGRK
jgi:FkbM family methyltransferase